MPDPQPRRAAAAVSSHFQTAKLRRGCPHVVPDRSECRMTPDYHHFTVSSAFRRVDQPPTWSALLRANWTGSESSACLASSTDDADPGHDALDTGDQPAAADRRVVAYVRGWRGYFGFCQTPRVLTNLEAWIRRRLRSYLWRQWQNRPNCFNELRRLGVPKFHAAVAAGSPTGFWRMSDIRRSNRPCATRISTVSVFPASPFLPQLNPIEPPWYGPVCPVVWEG